jgi:hypothetical protein
MDLFPEIGLDKQKLVVRKRMLLVVVGCRWLSLVVVGCCWLFVVVCCFVVCLLFVGYLPFFPLLPLTLPYSPQVYGGKNRLDVISLKHMPE